MTDLRLRIPGPQRPGFPLVPQAAAPVELVDQDSRAIITRRSIGHPLPYDLDGDGCMDIVFTGGVFTKGEETKLWVVYGKLKNMPVDRRFAAASPDLAEGGQSQ